MCNSFNKLYHPNMMPSDLPALFLEDITQRFSEEHKVGSGGYGEVYKGLLNNGTEIAVKKLYDVRGLDDAQFKNEFSNLMKVQHKNIIRFIGYCNETRHAPFELNGEHILGKRIYKVLCFEYLPRGSLDKHLSQESKGLDWCTRYQIMKGICEGLNYLHKGLEEPIFHLDLKPANILLDKNMMPKIADFGVSRPFGGTHTYTTKVRVGSEYYMAPEYISRRQISNKNDIFSLGIIMIQIMAGTMGYAKCAEMSSTQQFMDHVINNWSDRIGATSKYVKEDCQQVKSCLEIAVSCIEADRHKRPTISDIIHELKETETYTAESSSRDADATRKVEDTVDKVKTAEEWLQKSPLVGREKDINDFRFVAKGWTNRVIAVWGMSGVGKSSFVKDFYCKEHIRHEVVIDGLRSVEEWDLIKVFFETFKGCVIVITSDESVAQYCATERKCVWNVKGLDIKHAIDLFNKVYRMTLSWEEGMHILPKCGGLPKVIRVVAELYCCRSLQDLDNLTSMLATRKDMKDLFAWLLSYFHSCPDFLKPFIFYLSIFPPNHAFRQRRLVRRWISEGYFKGKRESDAEEDGRRSFLKLVDLSMIQQVSDTCSESLPLYHVNGFLREYIISRSMEENLVFALEGHCRKNLQRTGRHLAIEESWDRDRNVFESIDFSRLRSLTVFGKWESFFISSKMRLLRVLDLENVSFSVNDHDVEEMVRLLPRLKFLSLRRCRGISSLPDSLGDLKHLETLDIRETSIFKLPKSTIKLEKLQYIRAGNIVSESSDDAKGMVETLPSSSPPPAPLKRPSLLIRPRASQVPNLLSKFCIQRQLHNCPNNGLKVPRGIGKLSDLHTLGVFNIGNAAGGKAILEELENLTQLHKLGVCGISRNNSAKFFSAISGLAHLHSLSLQVQVDDEDSQDVDCMEHIHMSVSLLFRLQSLKLYGPMGRLPNVLMKNNWYLRKLNLKMRTLTREETAHILRQESLHTLRLCLAEFPNGELYLSRESDRDRELSAQFFSLSVLEIVCNSRLQAVRFIISEWIQVLKIRCCSVSPSLQFSGLERMYHLNQVWLSGSYEDALKQHLDRELEKNRKKPVLKLEGPSSST